MPLLQQSDSDEDMGIETVPLRDTVEQATPPSGPQRTFVSKTDLMSGIMDDENPDYDFMDDSDDSDLEIYGQVKGMKPSPLVYSIADSDEEEDYQQDSGVAQDVDQM